MRRRLQSPQAQAFSAALALAGLFAVTTPVYVRLAADPINDLVVLAPVIGGLAFAAFLIARFARGWLSGGALAIIALPVYFAGVLAAIAAAMRVAGLA